MDIVSKITGNTLGATEFNQLSTELEALQTSSGQTSSDAILNQISIATARYAANNFYIDSGAADAYVLTLAASMTSPVSATVGYFEGMQIRFRAGNAGTGGAATVNVGGAGVKSLKEADGSTNLSSIPTTEDSNFRYDGTVFRKVNNNVAASTTVSGIVELLTNAELAAGTDTTRAATAAALLSLFSASTLSTSTIINLPVNAGGAFDEITIQSGSFSYNVSAGTDKVVSLNESFDAANQIVLLQQTTYTGSGSTLEAVVTTKTTSNFTVRSGTNPETINWIAFGY